MTCEGILAQWDKMSPRERDVWVAEVVMGHKVDTSKIYCVHDLTEIENSGPFYRVRNLRRYSNNISAAWAVLEHMRTKSEDTFGCKACIEVHGTNNLEEPYWACIWGQEAGGKTAAEAICKAALLAVHQVNNNKTNGE